MTETTISRLPGDLARNADDQTTTGDFKIVTVNGALYKKGQPAPHNTFPSGAMFADLKSFKQNGDLLDLHFEKGYVLSIPLSNVLHIAQAPAN